MPAPRPISENPLDYEVEVVVKFNFIVSADSQEQAEDIATYEWEENTFQSTIESVWAEALEVDEDDPTEMLGDEYEQ